MRRNRRRGSSLADDSLELLLDTICNTFGGVLFIAILLAISVRPEPTVATLSNPENAMNRARAETLAAELSDLELLLDQQRRLIEALSLNELQRMDEGNEDLLETVDSVNEEVSSRDAMLSQMNEAAERSEETLASLDGSLARERQRERELRETLEETYRAREQIVALPDVSKTAPRTQVGWIIQYGRLYRWHRFDALGFPDGLNTDDMYVRDSTASGVQVSPIPTRGVDLNDEQAATRILSKFSRFKPSQHEFAVIVRNDSFAQFGLVRDVIKANSFRYTLFAGNHEVLDRGGSRRPTQ